MRSLLAVSLLAVAATAGAQTYAPLLPAESPVPTPTSLVVPNVFGGDITATFTVSEFQASPGYFLAPEFNFAYIDGLAFYPQAGSITTLTFSESITRVILGWASAGAPEFFYAILDGAETVDEGSVASMSVDPQTGNTQAFLDYTREAGFTSIMIAANGEFALGYSTAAVPEASTYGLILGGLALAGAAVRRRKHSK